MKKLFKIRVITLLVIPAAWIFWQCAGTVTLRFIIIWLYNNTGESLLAAILCHTSINMREYAFSNYGSHYDPFFFGILLIPAALAIVFFWDLKTLARYRFIQSEL